MQHGGALGEHPEYHTNWCNEISTANFYLTSLIKKLRYWFISTSTILKLIAEGGSINMLQSNTPIKNIPVGKRI